MPKSIRKHSFWGQFPDAHLCHLTDLNKTMIGENCLLSYVLVKVGGMKIIKTPFLYTRTHYLKEKTIS